MILTKTLHRGLLLSVCGLWLLAVARPATAAVNISVQSDGSTVNWTATGSVNLGGSTYDTTFPISPLVDADDGFIIGAPGGSVDGYYATDFAPEQPAIGPGTGGVTANSGTGGIFGLDTVSGYFYVPQGYVSNTNFTSTATYQNQSLASLGIVPGTYEWAWNASGHTEFVFMNVLPEPPAPQLIQINITGTVTADTTLVSGGNSPAPGTQVTAHFVIDPSKPDSAFATSNLGSFAGAVVSAYVQAGSFVYQDNQWVDANGNTSVASTRINVSPSGDEALLRLFSLDATGPVDDATGTDGNQIFLQLYNTDTGSLGSLDEFPTLAELNNFLAGLDPQSFGEVFFTGNRHNAALYFSLDQISAAYVPEPASLAVLMLGGMAMSIRRRR
ncbi:MAG: PEP-CTERM sorting domain-containing protein [Phycisphaera sp.]|nr:PEP-CTERM sorting domain-containing protein [Phycisphaera sp.]